jgi:hypothetical protein
MCVYYVWSLKFLLYRIFSWKCYLCVLFFLFLALNVHDKCNPPLRKTVEQNCSDMQKCQNYILGTFMQTRELWLSSGTDLVCLTLKMIALRLLETSGRTCWATHRHIPEDFNFQYCAEHTYVGQFKVNTALPVLAVGIHPAPHFRFCGLLKSICRVSFFECNW